MLLLKTLPLNKLNLFTMATPIGFLGLRFEKEDLIEVHFLKEKLASVPKAKLSQQACKTIDKIQAYFDKDKPLIDIPLVLKGTPLQCQVWQALYNIPYGETLTYGELAYELKTSPRAIGMACRTNRIPLVIPCHRIVAKNGWGGFAGRSEEMLKIKKWLIQHEGK